MSTTTANAHVEPRTGLFMMVWMWLLILTGIEVFLGYKQIEVRVMLTILMSLSIIKAGLIMSYFMHLRFERLRLVITLVPALVVLICIITVFFFPDAVRLFNAATGK